VNADALDDLVAGDRTGSGPFTRPEAGAVFVLFGRSSWPSYYDLGAQPADLTVYGAQTGDGLSQAILGDLSGDDQPDLIMRTRGITTAVLFGPRAAGIVDLVVTPLRRARHRPGARRPRRRPRGGRRQRRRRPTWRSARSIRRTARGVYVVYGPRRPRWSCPGRPT
jgi:hypothetical protein